MILRTIFFLETGGSLYLTQILIAFIMLGLSSKNMVGFEFASEY